MKVVTHIDEVGRKFSVELPDNAPPEHAKFGVLLGPPDLSSLGLPLDLEVRLNNALHARGLLALRDLRRRRGELLAVWQSVLSTDIARLTSLYANNGNGET